MVLPFTMRQNLYLCIGFHKNPVRNIVRIKHFNKSIDHSWAIARPLGLTV